MLLSLISRPDHHCCQRPRVGPAVLCEFIQCMKSGYLSVALLCKIGFCQITNVDSERKLYSNPPSRNDCAMSQCLSGTRGTLLMDAFEKVRAQRMAQLAEFPEYHRGPCRAHEQ